MVVKGKFYKEFCLKKILECRGAKSWRTINVGDTVQLISNHEKYDLPDLKRQVGVLVKAGSEGEEEIIGLIPEEEGQLIKDFLDMGWGTNDNNDVLFSAVISQRDDTKPLENRFKIAVYINKKERILENCQDNGKKNN